MHLAACRSRPSSSILQRTHVENKGDTHRIASQSRHSAALIARAAGGEEAHSPPAGAGGSSTSASPSTAAADTADTAAAPPPRGGAAAASRMSRLLQNVNVTGTALFFRILATDQSLAVPHISVPDIRRVDWRALARAGFRAAAFDKDNTLCAPFALEIAPELRASVEAARAAFGGRLALYSNSAGLEQYDPEGREADELEAKLGIYCLRHREKKPGGGAGELEAHFGCPAVDIVFIGDRYLTDVVFGNRHGMLTVRVAPLTLAGEPPGVRAARAIEERCVARWAAAGVKAPPHARLPPGRAVMSVVAGAGGSDGGGGSGGGGGK